MLEVKAQATAYVSPWSRRDLVLMALWRMVRLFLFRPTPKPFRAWRVFLLRLFGARITGTVFVAASARVRIPWLLEMRDRACLGDGVDAYNLGPLLLKERCTVAQDVMLCGGTHDFSSRRLPLVVGQITVGADAFIGARAIVLPGVTIGEGAVVGAGAVARKDVEPMDIVAGNPARVIGRREWKD